MIQMEFHWVCILYTTTRIHIDINSIKDSIISHLKKQQIKLLERVKHEIEAFIM
jgi:hypothetical protein